MHLDQKATCLDWIHVTVPVTGTWRALSALSSASVQSFNFMTHWMLCSTKGQDIKEKERRSKKQELQLKRKAESFSDDNRGTLPGCSSGSRPRENPAHAGRKRRSLVKKVSIKQWAGAISCYELTLWKLYTSD